MDYLEFQDLVLNKIDSIQNIRIYSNKRKFDAIENKIKELHYCSRIILKLYSSNQELAKNLAFKWSFNADSLRHSSREIYFLNKYSSENINSNLQEIYIDDEHIFFKKPQETKNVIDSVCSTLIINAYGNEGDPPMQKLTNSDIVIIFIINIIISGVFDHFYPYPWNIKLLRTVMVCGFVGWFYMDVKKMIIKFIEWKNKL